MKFTDLNLSEDIQSAVVAAGFEKPSPIQELTIPLALEGKDVIGQAQTGTGKTAAFGLPTLDKIRTEENTIQALVIAPTRELAVQSQEELFRFGQFFSLDFHMLRVFHELHTNTFDSIRHSC